MHRDQKLEERDPSRSSTVLPRWKRTVDVICSIAALPLLGFLTFVFGIVAATVARGPVFFRQENIGYGGRRIRPYRFRTMRERAPSTAQRTPRGAQTLIPGGRFLRASGLAELPQIINVLRGEMSMVGPRPVFENEFVSAEPSRVIAVPGLTGLWRVSHRGESTADQTAQLDVVYAESKSLRLDFRIILLTIPVVCVNAMGAMSSKSTGTALHAKNAAAESASLRAPSQQPW
jgi:lipopolysaccharide/colanic/teichoic acid biosynthesis glycosyltransferase